MEIYSPFIINAIIGIILGGIASLIVGSLSMLRGVHYLSAEVTHAALGGAAIGALIYDKIKFEPIFFIMALTFSILTSIVTGYIVRERGVEASGMAIGISLAISLSIYAIIIGLIRSELIIRVNSYLLSDILLITYSDIINMTIISIIGLLTLIFLHREFIYICFDLEGTEAMGLKTNLYDYLIFTLIGALGVVIAKAMGALLVFALAIVPASCSMEIAKNANRIFIYTFLISISSGIIGLWISIILNLPTSGVIAITAVTIYVIVKVLKKSLLE